VPRYASAYGRAPVAANVEVVEKPFFASSASARNHVRVIASRVTQRIGLLAPWQGVLLRFVTAHSRYLRVGVTFPRVERRQVRPFERAELNR